MQVVVLEDPQGRLTVPLRPRDYRSSFYCRSATRRIRSMRVAEGVTLPDT